MEKIKKTKENKRHKSKRVDDGNDSDDVIAHHFMKKTKLRPGQFDNCATCEKRFTVTAYSKTGPNGGLLCQKCSKEMADEEKKAKPKKRGPAKKGRRQAQSNLLDGFVQRGAPKLLETCIKVSLKEADLFDTYSIFEADLTRYIENRG